jgi:benzoate membrane transport protein
VCLIFSWITRQPVMVAWSIPGAALLITQLGLYPFSDVIGAYIVCGVVSAILGATGWLGKLLAAVPKPITAAVLAGVLFPFVIKVATAVVATPIVAGGLVLGYLVGRRWNPRYAVLVAVAVGGLLVVTTGATQALAIRMAVTVPTWTTPTFSLDAILGIAVPLFIVTAAGQNTPGLIVMHHSGYEANDRLLLGACGVASVLFAPFASHQLNMAAVTAAIATSGESHPDKNRRYIAGMSCGVFYILGGLLATFIVSLFSAIPARMITALAGVALLSPLQASLYDTMHEGTHQKSVLEAALITLAVTVSGIQPLGVVSAFWGLLAGVVAGRLCPGSRMALESRGVLPNRQGTDRPRRAPGAPLDLLAPLGHPGHARPCLPGRHHRRPTPRRRHPHNTDHLDRQRIPPTLRRTTATAPPHRR